MDLNKKLSDIKSTIPVVNKNLSVQIYKNYRSKLDVKVRKLSPKITFAFSLFTIFIICIVSIPLILNNKSKNDILYDDTILLSKVVYNTSVKENEDYQIINQNNNARFSNNFQYKSLSIYRSYGFEVTFDFVMTPYFDDYVIGDKVEVIIAMLELYSGKEGSYPFAQDMIILCYKNQIYGFLSPTSGIIDELNPRNEKNLDFGSYMFLTKNQVVKYYERGDYLYDFDLIDKGSHEIVLKVRQSKAFDNEFGEQKYNVNIIEDSYIELCSNEVIDLVNLSMVEIVEIEAIINSIDLKLGFIYVTSKDATTLKSVSYTLAIMDELGNYYQITDLKEGDKIQIYYYKRYKNYKPVNIRVENIILK